MNALFFLQIINSLYYILPERYITIHNNLNFCRRYSLLWYDILRDHTYQTFTIIRYWLHTCFPDIVLITHNNQIFFMMYAYEYKWIHS